jgi:hypothetical protein
MSCNSCSNVTLPGVAGPAGAVGPAGETGPSSTITVGTVTSGSPAAVVDVGTPGAAIFNFTIPTGATGPQGPSGTSVIYNTVTEVTTPTTTNPFALMGTAPLSVNELQEVGDMIVCDFEFYTDNPTQTVASGWVVMSVETGGSDTLIGYDSLPQFANAAEIRIYLIKDGATSVNVRYEVTRKTVTDFSNDDSSIVPTSPSLITQTKRTVDFGSITMDFSNQYDIHTYGKTANASFPLKLSRFTVIKHLIQV